MVKLRAVNKASADYVKVFAAYGCAAIFDGIKPLKLNDYGLKVYRLF